MIEIDFEKLNEAEVQQVITTTGQIIKEWSSENKFFSQMDGHPLINKDTYAKSMHMTTQKFRELSQLNTAVSSKFSQNKNQNIDYSSDIAQLVAKIKEFFDLYNHLRSLTDSCFPLQRTEEQFLIKLDNIEQAIFVDSKSRIEKLSSSLTTTIESQIAELSSNLKEQIESGIKDLIGLKSELGLAKEFGEKIQSELEAAQKKEQRFMLAFIIALVLIPISVFCTNFLTEGMTDAISGYILKGSIAISLLFVSLFFFSQYRTYMMIRLRYTHLDGFLGGGATFISQLLEADSPDLKLEVNKKLAEMFMSLDDVLKMVQKSKHPTELTLETAETVFDKVSKFKK
ncbi:hypothetical protein SD340_004303 [Vibrio fluvialis]|nr:hypothetical protein [Vibrio fluvialis]ELU8402389.1 hypothetical protein [Vibrio fluvialis]